MEIPARLRKILAKKKAHELEGALQITISQFGKWFEENKIVFFPDYTDHGLPHIQAVCESMVQLITKESLPHLTTQDCAAIVLSALLHDSAMHLTVEGFQDLLESEEYSISEEIPVPVLNWRDLWDAYEREATRWNEEQCRDILAQPDPAGKLGDNPEKWTKTNYRYIGEFLRRYHAEIGYYIARFGVPGPEKDRLQLIGIEPQLADIAGFIARSHNYALRESVDLLAKSGRNHLWIHGQVHIPYIMGLLRVADYLEIGPERAPAIASKWRSLYSPRSQQEWSNHQAIENCTTEDENDDEGLWVEAKPKNVKTFLRLKALLDSIQQEVDATWAIWGEVYGRHPKLKILGMTYRRIRSNIDDVEEFGKTVNYVPTHAKFRTSDGELLKLLTGPLYGERPEFGVRELVQNAVDACLERDNFLKHHPELKSELVYLRDEADVSVTLTENEDGSGSFIIEDTGIGMTEEVIQKYFLTAGASFRSSNEWQETHAKDGNSEVLRTGRFGVGLLAAFLLGDEIEVRTRHVSKAADRGIYLKCKLESPDVEIRWINEKCKIGTTIIIHVNKRIFSTLLTYSSPQLETGWDWYTGTNPKLIRCLKIHPNSKRFRFDKLRPEDRHMLLPQKHRFPSEGEELSNIWEWRRITDPNYSDIHWTWHWPFLACNNILITHPTLNPMEHMRNPNYLWDKPRSSHCPFSIHWPSLSIFDRNGVLPINLQRTNINYSELHLLKASLLNAVCRDILAFLLVKAGGSIEKLLSKHPAIMESAAEIEYTGLISGLNLLMAGSSGFTLVEPGMMQWADMRIATLMLDYSCSNSLSFSEKSTQQLSQTFRLFHQSDLKISQDANENAINTLWWVQAVLEDPLVIKNNDRWEYAKYQTYFFPILPFIPKSHAVLINRNFEYHGNLVNLHCTQITENFLLYSTAPTPDWLDMQYLKTLCKTVPTFPIGFWLTAPDEIKEIPLSPLAQTWKDIIGRPLIPFDLETRKRELAHAYEELAPEIACWEKGGTYEAARELERQQRQNTT